MAKNLSANAGDARDTDSIPGSGRYPGEGNGNPLRSTPVFLPGKSHGQRSLVRNKRKHVEKEKGGLGGQWVGEDLAFLNRSVKKRLHLEKDTFWTQTWGGEEVSHGTALGWNPQAEGPAWVKVLRQKQFEVRRQVMLRESERGGRWWEMRAQRWRAEAFTGTVALTLGEMWWH